MRLLVMGLLADLTEGVKSFDDVLDDVPTDLKQSVFTV